MLLGLLCVAAIVVGGESASALAADVYHCNQIDQPGDPCPSFYGGDRHTYKNERTSWSTTINYSCGVPIYQELVHDSSPPAPPGSTKYSAVGYCYLNESYPNNTQYLRGWSWQTSGDPWWLVGVAGY